MRQVIIIVLAVILALSCSSTRAYDFYVSPDGNDNNTGTQMAPFATLDKARLAVRELKKNSTETLL